MECCYCFANASLTRRVLQYLLRRVQSYGDCATVIFLNDRWVIRLKLDESLSAHDYDNCVAFLAEHGLPYQCSPAVFSVLKALDLGCDITQVMNHHHVAIVSHGVPSLKEVNCFQQQFVAGLGYCPPSLI